MTARICRAIVIVAAIAAAAVLVIYDKNVWGWFLLLAFILAS